MTRRAVKPKPHTAGIVGFLVTALGLVLETLRDSGELAHMPHWCSIVVLVGGAVLQALTKGVQQGGTVLVTRDEATAFGVVKPKEKP